MLWMWGIWLGFDFGVKERVMGILCEVLKV